MKRASFKNTLGLLAIAGAILLSLQMAHPQAPATKIDPNTGLPEEPRLNLDIEQGTLKRAGQPRPATVANVVQLLQAQVPDANFVLAPGVSEIVVSNLTLRSANLQGALDALGVATGFKVRAGSVGKGNVYALTLGQAARPEMKVEAFNLSPVLDPLGARDSREVRQRIEQISTLIIQTLMDFDNRTQQQRVIPLINFSDSTGLLVVIGYPEQLEIASKIIKALNPPGRAEVTPESRNKKPDTSAENPKARNSAEPRETTP